MMKVIRFIGQAIMVVVIAIGGFLVWVFWVTAPETPTKSASSPESDIRSQARYLCKAVIEDQLKDPKSAEWGWSSGNYYASWPASIDGDVVTVQPRFRANNGFGALTLNQFVCKIDTTGDWSLLELREL